MKRLCTILAVGLCAAGCGTGAGEGGDPGATLRQTAPKLGDIRSGDLDFRLTVEPKGSDTERVGWEVKGPFELGGGGRPPPFQIDYTQRRGDEEATVTVTLTGGKAYVALGDETFEMPAGRAQALTWASTALAGGEGFGELDIRGWLRLSDAVEHATVDVLTGKDDGLLRRLNLELDLGLDVPDPLRATLGSIVGAGVELKLTIEHPNEAVSIRTPPAAHPTSEFPGG